MKPRTCRAVGSNIGTQKLFAQKLAALTKRFNDMVASDIVHMLIDEGFLTKPEDKDVGEAQDASFWQIFRKLKAAGFFPSGSIGKRIDEFTAERSARWLIKAQEDAKDVSHWFARALARDVTSSQRRSLEAAGLSTNWMKDKWTVPIIGKQYVSPSAAKAIEEAAKSNVELITKIATNDLARLQSVITENLESGGTVADLRKSLQNFEGFDEKRAARVALDQSNKYAAEIQRRNAKAIGITKGIWIHVPGKFTSRETHIAMNGKEFDLDKGLYDSAVGQWVVPGQLPYCRCQFRQVLPTEVLHK